MSNEPTTSRRTPMIPAPAPGPRQAMVPHKENGGAPANIIVRPPLGLQPGQTPAGDIAKAIASVMTQVGIIEKRGFNKFHGYHYARMEDVLQALTPLMGQAGLAVMQNESEVQNIEGNRIRIIYEFTLFHQNGQALPPVRQSGTAMARDSKGNFDDKCFAKAHTNARKYYLLGLFGVPAGDFPDPDESEDDDANRRRASGPAPGPKPAPAKGPAAAPAKEETPGEPRQLLLPEGTTAEQWSEAYIRAIGKAKTQEEIAAWDKLNDAFLQRISDRYSAIYDRIRIAVEQRLQDIGTPAPAEDQVPQMPDPKADPGAAMNWTASQLQAINSYPTAVEFWNKYVAPREAEFDTVDWGMLLGEWKRTETRLGAPADEGEPQ